MLLLITKDCHDPLAPLALRYARSFLAEYDSKELELFFYADGASFANRLSWQTADQHHLGKQWQDLAKNYSLDLPVCVSTALARGITDQDNAQRHQLTADNLADGFRLVGLTDLIMKMNNHKVIQF